MAYIGAPPLNRVLSSADIAQGAVTLDDINFTDQPTNMDITGVIDNHTMRLADGVTITGDVTISDDLVLSKISDDGNAITMTNDGSSRTITGSGSIEAATLVVQGPNQVLTGMTGTIGSAVTGGAGLSGMTSLGAVTSGSLATGVHGKYVMDDFQVMNYTTQTLTYSANQDNFNVSGSGTVAGTNHLAITTGSSTSDLLEFNCDFGRCYNDLDGTAASAKAQMGFGMQRSAATDFSSPTTMFATGRQGWGGRVWDNTHITTTFNKIFTVAEWSLAASTSYKIRLIGFTGESAGTFYWGQTGGTGQVFMDGVRITYRRWRFL